METLHEEPCETRETAKASINSCDDLNLEHLEKLLLEYEAVKHAVTTHENYAHILRDYAAAEAGIARSSHVAMEGWRLVILSRACTSSETRSALSTKAHLKSLESVLNVSVYALGYWLRLLEGETLPETRVLN